MARVRRRWPAWVSGLRDSFKLVCLAFTAERDATLVRLAAELAANERSLRALFADDGRDTEDIPEFQVLADRHGNLVEQICLLPAHGVGGLAAKALGVRLRDPATGYDDAIRLGASLAEDVLRIFGTAT